MNGVEGERFGMGFVGEGQRVWGGVGEGEEGTSGLVREGGAAADDDADVFGAGGGVRGGRGGRS